MFLLTVFSFVPNAAHADAVQASLFSNRVQLIDFVSISPYDSYTQAWGNQFGRDGSFTAKIFLSQSGPENSITFS